MEKLQGIYKITNMVNNKMYVGSSINIERRFYEHKHGLKNGNHPNKHLQSAWLKYGKEKFVFETIEIVEDEGTLTKREQYWMDKFESYNDEKGYNINPTAGSQLGRKVTNEQKIKIMESSKSRKPIIQLDVNGNLINKFPSIRNAADAMKISTTAINTSLKNKKFFQGFIWVLESEFLLNEFDFRKFTEHSNYIPPNHQNLYYPEYKYIFGEI